MKRLVVDTLLASILLSACISISSANKTPSPVPQFVTSTLPPTKSLVSLPSRTPLNSATKIPTLAVTPSSDCTDKAVLMEDVTIPDETHVPAGETFTKTWRIKNTGTCPWIGYSVVFALGDRMSAPISSPVPQTDAKSSADISLELVAPADDGVYAGYFTLHNADDEIVPIGIEKTFWVKIIVGEGIPASTKTPAGTSDGVEVCDFSANPGYIGQVQALINTARSDVGLPELIINVLLTNAAQDHSEDMACSSLLSHTGSDGSSVHSRIVGAGYSPSYSEEIIYAGGDAHEAFDWWMNDPSHRDAILSEKSSEMGIGFAYVASSTYGGYFTVDFASP